MEKSLIELLYASSPGAPTSCSGAIIGDAPRRCAILLSPRQLSWLTMLLSPSTSRSSLLALWRCAVRILEYDSALGICKTWHKKESMLYGERTHIIA